jgi:hypothetical protein
VPVGLFAGVLFAGVLVVPGVELPGLDELELAAIFDSMSPRIATSCSTWLNCDNSDTNCVLSTGLVGSWFFNCEMSNCKNICWLEEADWAAEAAVFEFVFCDEAVAFAPLFEPKRALRGDAIEFSCE